MDSAILLTGATGYIGGRLLRRFEEAAAPCVVWRAEAAVRIQGAELRRLSA